MRSQLQDPVLELPDGYYLACRCSVSCLQHAAHDALRASPVAIHTHIDEVSHVVHQAKSTKTGGRHKHTALHDANLR